MRITRLVTGAACGATALALTAPAAAAWADPGPKAVANVPTTFEPGDDLRVRVTGCGDARPRTGAGLTNEIFAAAPAFRRDGDVWRTVGATRTGLRPGRTYLTEFRCGPPDRRRTFPLEVTVPRRSPSPGEDFEFGFDKVKLSSRTVTPGGEMTFTVTCPTEVSARSASFAEAPEFTEDGEDSFEGTATFKETLPSIVAIKVFCADHGHVTYSTRPDEDDLGDGGPKIPKGAPNTGGGTGGQGPGATPFGGAALALLAAGALGALGARSLRRRAGEQRPS
ncbi:hypothetical protein SAMN04489712_103216 [Thermomonospora echinospora]|uniref:Uncharacterized protein n=1 Tax=Thermomonospora echinospora TaxID=1992 RepID=A0A1H5XEE0_9ACTN|nr:hypothetical protein [Thermomonospora echinospora]SEG10079.1 hypothetical protein SAMN04489712_103216 [Thermomonospora echinospora]